MKAKTLRRCSPWLVTACLALPSPVAIADPLMEQPVGLVSPGSPRAEPANASPSAAEKLFALQVKTVEARVSEIGERNLRAKARVMLLRAALASTQGLAKNRDQAMSHAILAELDARLLP